MHIEQIELSRIEPNPRNPRRTIHPDSIQELAESIKAQGLLQPITVRQVSKDRKGKALYQIVLGERRYRASELAGLETIDCIIRDMTDREVMEAMLVENLQRVDVDPIEEARYVSAALSDGWTPAEVGARLGKSAKWVAIRIQIASMAEAILELVRNGSIGIAHVQALAQVKDPELRLQLASSAAEDKMTVSELHAEILKHQRKLADAPWKMNLKLGNCPACLGCADRSDRQGDLFGGEKNALCLNSKCWVEKLEAHKEALKQKLEAQGIEVHTDDYSARAFENGWNGFTKDESVIKELKEAGVKAQVIIKPDGSTVEAYSKFDLPKENRIPKAKTPKEIAEDLKRDEEFKQRKINNIQEQLLADLIAGKKPNDSQLLAYIFDAILYENWDSDLEDFAGTHEDGDGDPERNEMREKADVDLDELRRVLWKWAVSSSNRLNSEYDMWNVKQKPMRAKAEKQYEKELAAQNSDDEESDDE